MLSQEEKRRIEEEETYRAKGRNKVNKAPAHGMGWAPGCAGFFVAIICSLLLSFVILIVVIMVAG